MAKNKNNGFKNTTSGSSKNTSTGSSKSNSGNSMKDSHAQVPDKSPARSGPGGE